MKIIIIGAGGVIGNALFKTFSSRFPDCLGLTTKNNPPLMRVDYNFPSLHKLVTKADVVIYCAGVTKFAACEQMPEKSLFLNAQLPQEILKNLSAGQTLIYFSSPVAIYDFGNSPVPAYALHKRMAEEGLQQGNVVILRPSKVIESADIVRNWKSAIGKGEKVIAYSDQFISPVSTALLSDQLVGLLEGGKTGPYNFSAGDRISYLDLAKALCAYFKLDPGLIETRSARHDNPFFLEQDVLDCVAAQKAIGYTPPFSRDILQSYLRTLA